MAEQEVDYSKINENIFFQFIMHDMDLDLEENTLHSHQLAINEIVLEFHVHLEPPMDNQLAFSSIWWKMVTFTRHVILKAIPTTIYLQSSRHSPKW